MAQQRLTRSTELRALARRLGLSGGRLAALACVALVITAALVGLLWRGGSAGVVVERGGAPVEGAVEKEEGESQAAEVEEVRSALVHVDGAVESPGVYQLLGSDLRINDAVAAAGGLREDSDTTALNLAAPVGDGDKVRVPFQGEAASPSPDPGAPAAPAGSASPQLVNINTADAATLVSLPGVGEATAKAIVKDREKNGPFATVEDLMRVSGVGEKKFEAVKDLIRV